MLSLNRAGSERERVQRCCLTGSLKVVRYSNMINLSLVTTLGA